MGGGLVTVTALDLRRDGVEALMVAHRQEVMELQARLFAAEALLAQHGLAAPSDGLEHLEVCRRIVRGAYELLPQLERLDGLVGAGKEMLGEAWRG